MLDQLKAGDKIIVVHISGWRERWKECIVAALTPKQIVVTDAYRYRIEDGKEVGGHDRAYHPDQAVENWGSVKLTARQHLERYRQERREGRCLSS